MTVCSCGSTTALADAPSGVLPQVLARMLDARQLGLKLIANVTYGYTSASFSGRMPCVELADAIVQTGRDTLQRVRRGSAIGSEWWMTLTCRDHGGDVSCGLGLGQAKRTIEAEFPAKVVYGDTDRSAATTLLPAPRGARRLPPPLSSRHARPTDPRPACLCCCRA